MLVAQAVNLVCIDEPDMSRSVARYVEVLDAFVAVAKQVGELMRWRAL